MKQRTDTAMAAVAAATEAAGRMISSNVLPLLSFNVRRSGGRLSLPCRLAVAATIVVLVVWRLSNTLSSLPRDNMPIERDILLHSERAYAPVSAPEQVEQAALLSSGAKLTDVSLAPLSNSTEAEPADTDHTDNDDDTNADPNVSTDTCAEYLSAIPIFLKEPLQSSNNNHNSNQRSTSSSMSDSTARSVTLSIHAASYVNFTMRGPTLYAQSSPNQSFRIRMSRQDCFRNRDHKFSDNHKGVWYRLILPKPDSGQGHQQKRQVRITARSNFTFWSHISVFEGSCISHDVNAAAATPAPANAAPANVHRSPLGESMQTNLLLQCDTSTRELTNDPLSNQTFYMWVWLENEYFLKSLREMNEAYVSPSMPLVELSLSLMVPPKNDQCANATHISIGNQFIRGNLSYATGDEIETIAASNDRTYKESVCSFKSHFGSQTGHDPGVWYTFQGTGDRVSVKAMRDAFTGNFFVYAFQGRCNYGHDSQLQPRIPTTNGTFGVTPPHLQCIASAGPYELRFDTTVNVTYYLLVQGPYDLYKSSFSLSIYRVDPLYNGYAMATPIALGSTIVADLNIAKSVETADDCLKAFPQGWVRAYGIWYQFQGTGGPLTIDSCRPDSACTFISIYTNTSNTLGCVAGNKGDREKGLVFYSEINTTYYAQVRRYDSGVSNNEIKFSIDVAPVPVNDRCMSALPIAVGTETVANLSYATSYDNEVPAATCLSGTAESNSRGVWNSFQGNSRGVWYSFQGNGKILAVRAPNKESALSLYHGPSCGSLVLQCVEGRIVHGEFLFEALVNTTYYALLRGWRFSYGYLHANLTLAEANRTLILQ